MTYEEMNKEQLQDCLEKLKVAIKKHRDLAYWGNVDSKERLRDLRWSKKRVEELLKKK